MGTNQVPGKFGSAVAIQNGGVLAYPTAGNLSFQDGTVEMWVSPQFDGSNSVYTQTPQVLFQYFWGNSGNLALALNDSVGFFVLAGPGATTAGQSALAWKARNWHHLAFTYSTTQGRVRWYVDGLLVSEYETAIQISAAGETSFMVGSDAFGHASTFLIDELRISNNEATSAQILNDATRPNPFGDNEVMLSLSGLSADQLTYSVTGCGTARYDYIGVPVAEPSPPSTLLPSGATSVQLSVQTPVAAACRYSVNTVSDYSSMTAFTSGQGAATRATMILGLFADPTFVNSVYVRCTDDLTFVLPLKYRAIAQPASLPYPRIANVIWTKPLIDAFWRANCIEDRLFESAPIRQSDSLSPTLTDILALRTANSNTLVLLGFVTDQAGGGSRANSLINHSYSEMFQAGRDQMARAGLENALSRVKGIRDGNWVAPARTVGARCARLPPLERKRHQSANSGNSATKSAKMSPKGTDPVHIRYIFAFKTLICWSFALWPKFGGLSPNTSVKRSSAHDSVTSCGAAAGFGASEG